MSRALHATTPFPNQLLDEAMPYLKDTEWRLLCLIVRQTRGWRDQASNNRKTSDWLTQAQLIKKTGRDRAALSRAIDALVQRRYIEVRSGSGKLLLSPAERRQCKSRLFYGLHPRWLLPSAAGPQEIKSEYQAPVSNSLLNENVTKSEYHRAPKANTTKETLTKETLTKENVTKSEKDNSLGRLAAEVFGEIATETNDLPTQERLPYAEPRPSSQAQRFILLFEQLHRDAKNLKADTRLTTGSAERLEKLLTCHPLFDWSSVLSDFFNSSTGYIVRRRHSLEAFLGSCHIFLARRSLLTKNSSSQSLIGASRLSIKAIKTEEMKKSS